MREAGSSGIGTKLAVVIAAAGSGQAAWAPGSNKVLLPLDGKPMLQYSIECFAADGRSVQTMVVVTNIEVDLEAVRTYRTAGAVGRCRW